MINQISNSVGLVLITASVIQSAPVAAQESRPDVPLCKPVPKLEHYEVLPDDRESPAPHRGQIRVSFVISPAGRVTFITNPYERGVGAPMRDGQGVAQPKPLPHSRGPLASSPNVLCLLNIIVHVRTSITPKRPRSCRTRNQPSLQQNLVRGGQWG